MEESKPAQTTSIPNPNPNPNSNPSPNPPSTAQTLPPLPPKSKKRSLESNNAAAHIQDSNYFKMRAVLKDLRPHFIEVLQTPDFRNCKAAHEIREQMKLLMDLYKQMTAETVSIGKCKNRPESQPLSEENGNGQKTQDVEPAEQPLPDQVPAKASEEKPVQPMNISEKLRVEDGRIHGTYVVGGSAFGWNFITYPGNKSVYYGVTKESFRAAAK